MIAMFGRLLCGAILGLAPIAATADVVAARTLRVGLSLKATDLRVTGDTAEDAKKAFIGLETRRIVYTGMALSADTVGPPTVVQRNDVVEVRYAFGGLGLRTMARSLAAGGIGDRIDVLNLDTRIKISATVVGPSAVEVRR